MPQWYPFVMGQITIDWHGIQIKKFKCGTLVEQLLVLLKINKQICGLCKLSYQIILMVRQSEIDDQRWKSRC